MHKPRIAIIGFTSCEGCQVEIVNLGERFLNLSEKADIIEFPLTEDKPDKGEVFDICFVEGAIVTKREEEKIRLVRNRTKILVVIGACASIGGVTEMKNYHDKRKLMDMVYQKVRHIDNLEVRSINKVVKVDFTIPGCPINREEFYRVACELIEGKIPIITTRPVCYECQLKHNPCFLKKKIPCLGPMTLGGCGAICPSNNFPCEGCRGPLKNANVKSIRNLLTKFITNEEFNRLLETFGVRDDAEALEKVWDPSQIMDTKCDIKKSKI